MSDRLIVLSDLHISPPGRPASLHAGPALAGFLLAHAAAGTTLVLAGDTFDFLRMDRPARLDMPGAPELFRTLLAGLAEAPWGRDVLGALAALLRAGGKCVLLPGDHDLELHHPRCRDVLLAALGLPGHPGLVFHLADEPWQTQLGRLAVVVGHGNRYDPWNEVDPVDVRRALAAGARHVVLPPGAQLVTEVMHAFEAATDARTGKPRFALLELFKPDVPAVPLLLWLLDAKLAAARFSATFGLGVPKLLRPLSRELSRGPALEGAEAQLQTTRHLPIGYAPAMADAFARAIADELPDDLRALPQLVMQRAKLWLEGDDGPAGTAERPAAGGMRRLAARALVRSLSRDAPNGDAGATSPNDDAIVGHLLSDDAGPRVAIFGHTHAARLKKLEGDRTYINAGTWTDHPDLPDVADEAAVSAWIDLLDHGQVKRRRRLTYAEVTPDGARLAEWPAPSAS
jgi:UDP-2,3-diacylglucosamine pyrophosphatase LpxH